MTVDSVASNAATVEFALLLPKPKSTLNLLPMFKKKVEQKVAEETKPVGDVGSEKKETFAEGVLRFIETFTLRSKAPVFGGVALSLLSIVVGLGAYFLATRETEDSEEFE